MGHFHTWTVINKTQRRAGIGPRQAIKYVDIVSHAAKESA